MTKNFEEILITLVMLVLGLWSFMSPIASIADNNPQTPVNFEVEDAE
jgi:hypothetical protein